MRPTSLLSILVSVACLAAQASADDKHAVLEGIKGVLAQIPEHERHVFDDPQANKTAVYEVVRALSERVLGRRVLLETYIAAAYNVVSVPPHMEPYLQTRGGPFRLSKKPLIYWDYWCKGELVDDAELPPAGQAVVIPGRIERITASWTGHGDDRGISLVFTLYLRGNPIIVRPKPR